MPTLTKSTTTKSKMTAPKKTKKSSPKEAPTKSKQAKSSKAEREIIYPEVKVEEARGKNALTADIAKELMGWHAEGENHKYKDDYLLKDMEDTKIRCFNNENNRPLVQSNISSLKQDMLRGHWRFNGEPIIIGNTGSVLNGQHTLIALILSSQEHAASPGKWITWRDKQITIDKLVVFGVEENDDTIHTIDTPKPRTFGDVMFLNEKLRGIDKRDRVQVARMIDYAVKMLWNRTGASTDAFAPKRTHSEALDFVGRHGKILDSVNHIYEENGTTKSISRYCPVGYAAALHYLMAASATPEDSEYGWNKDKMPDESMVDFGRWDQACEFWVLLAAGDSSLDAVRQSLLQLDEDDEYGHSLSERLALVIKAWDQWIEGGSVTRQNIALSYETDQNTGMNVLSESPTVGGIDLGDPA